MGLTEGTDTQDLKRKAGELSVLIHDEGDVVHLSPPDGPDYEAWCDRFLEQAAQRLGPRVEMLSDPGLRARLAASLRHHFENAPDTERVLRNWTKMAGLAPALLMSRAEPYASDELVDAVSEAAREVAGEMMPWDE